MAPTGLGDTALDDEPGHPSHAQLASFAWGGTAVGVDLAEHLAGCARCRDVVARARNLRPTVALGAGTMVGRYRIIEQIGHGGMGDVYRAIDVELERAVALKLVHARSSGSIEELTERLRRESRLQTRAAHPAVIQVHDIGRDGDRVYVAMELANGGTLKSWLARAPRRWRAIVDVFARAGEGLAAAHAAGLVHRDFKPDNVLVEETGVRVSRVLVTDFGVARVIEAVEQASSVPPTNVELTVTGALVGTPAYMAPEQLSAGPIDVRTDVFAFGVSLWEALYGARPYRGTSIGEIVGAMHEPLATPARAHERVPPWLERVVRKALAIEPGARHASMTELLYELDWRRRRTSQRIAGLVVATVAVAGVAGAVAVTREAPGAGVAASACAQPARGPARLAAALGELRAVALAPADAPYRDAWLAALARYVDATRELRWRMCATTPPSADRDARVRCIDAAADETALQAELVTTTGRGHLAGLVRRRFPAAPYECAAARTGVATTLAALHPDEAHARAVIETRLLLAEASQLAAAGASDRARERVDEAERRAQPTGFAPLRPEIAIARAALLPDSAAAIERMRDAAVAADRAEHVVAAADAALLAAMREADTNGKRASDLLAQAEVALDRAGNPPFSRVMVLASKAYVAGMTDPAATDRLVDEAERLLATLPFDPLSYARLGAAELRAGHFERAAALQRRAYDGVARLDAADPDVRFVRITYAGSLSALGQPDAGRELLEALLRGAPVRESDLQAVSTLANAYSQLGRDEDVLALVERYRVPIAARLGRSGPALRLLTLEASAAYSLGLHQRAHRACRASLDDHLAALGPGAYDTGDVSVLCGQIEVELGRLDEGRRAIEQGLATLVATAGANDPLALEGRIALGDVLLRQHHDADALRELEAAAEPYRALAPPVGAAKVDLLLARALVATKRDLPRARELVASAIRAWSADPATWKEELAKARALEKRMQR